MRIKNDLVNLLINVITAVNSFTGGIRGVIVALIVIGLLWASNIDEDDYAVITTADRLDTYVEFLDYCEDSHGFDLPDCEQFWYLENYE